MQFVQLRLDQLGRFLESDACQSRSVPQVLVIDKVVRALLEIGRVCITGDLLRIIHKRVDLSHQIINSQVHIRLGIGADSSDDLDGLFHFPVNVGIHCTRIIAGIHQFLQQLIETLVDEDSGLISLYYGEDVTKEEAEELAGFLGEKYEDLDIDLRYGGQPIYYYILSVE